MRRKTALIISGAVTAFVLMVVIGLIYGSNQLAAAAGTATPVSSSTPGAQVAEAPQAQSASPDTATAQELQDKDAQISQLQAEVQAYKTQLDQATTQLQQAYDQLQALANAQNGQQSGRGRFRQRNGNEFNQNSSGGSVLPFSGGDD